MIFPHLEIEQKVQINDRSRLNAAKSFVSAGSDPLTSVLIKPGADETAVEVFNADSEQWFLDWEFTSWKIDIDSSNNKLDFSEGGSPLVATLSSGTYTLATLLTQTKTQMDAAGVNTYTLTSDENDKITISSTGGFGLLPVTGDNRPNGILPVLGFLVDTDSSSEQTGKRVESLPRRLTVTCTDGAETEARTITIQVYSVEGDKLFSNDADLRLHEADILKYVPPGRNTFMDVHRRSQEKILKWLDKEGYVDAFEKKFTKAAIVDIDEVKEWSTYISLRLISEGIRTGDEDIWTSKAKSYKGYEVEARNRAVLRLDINQDGTIDLGEQVRISTGEIYRV